MQAHHKEMEQWAEDNGIDGDLFMFKMGGPGGHGMGWRNGLNE
jgi:hypothetical protein